MRAIPLIVLIAAITAPLTAGEMLRYVRSDGGGLPAIVAREGRRIYVAAQSGGGGDLKAQTRGALANVKTALAGAHAAPADVVRLDIHLLRGENPDIVRRVLGESFGEAKAPNEFILPVPELPAAESLIQISAMAVARPEAGKAGVTCLRPKSLPQKDESSAVSVVRSRGLLYLSGQSDNATGKHEPITDMAELARRSMEGMNIALKSARASFGDVANMVVYVSSLRQLGRLRQVSEGYFSKGMVPPVSYVARAASDGSNPWVEIDAEAAMPDNAPPPQRNEFISPDGLSPSRFYSYVVRAAAGRAIYIPAQALTEPSGSLEQAEAVYARIQRLLHAAGATFQDVVKVRAFLIPSGGTYEAINTVRTKLYDPSKPPASTLLGWDAIVAPGAQLQVDAVAVIPGR